MPHWLDQYANNHHDWHQTQNQGRYCFYRPFGLIEKAFDTDGIYHEGRADINATLDLDINSRLTDEQLHRRILLAWTVLRLNHVLLMSKAVDRQDYMTAGDKTASRYFLIDAPDNPRVAIEDASKHLVFTASLYDQVDASMLYRHAQNTGRVFDSDETLAKVFVLQTENRPRGQVRLHFLFVMSHQITDGLTNYTWLSHFVRLLNTDLSGLEDIISSVSPTHSIRTRLPVPQEDLYPPIAGSRARKRWFWLLTLVLRHVKKPMVPAFSNPLRREKPLAHAQTMPPVYDRLLDYTKTPPLNTFTCVAHIPKSATQRLHRLCREAGASIGAGCFVLTAMVMMSLYESRNPNIPLSSRQSFIGSFPINPRPFFNHAEAPNNLMLAFSDGVVLPFLSSNLDVEKRFKVLVLQAHRQLARYQKRKRPDDADMKAYMGSRGAGRVLAINYIQAIERSRLKLPAHLRDALGSHSPQGDLIVQPNPTMATCGVSSVGRSGWRKGEYDLETELPHGENAFVADYRGSKANVRARDGEFLVGIGGDDESISANVSYDGNAIDEELVMEWKSRMENILVDHSQRARL